MPNSSLSSAELRRYARHLNIPGFGTDAQLQLKQAKVLCIGAGGLGSPITMHLAAAGIGTIGIIDSDIVEESNLQRQLLHGTKDLGRPKLDSARDRLHDLNPHVNLQLHHTTFTANNAIDIARPYDLIIDGTDNFPTRYLSNDVAVFLKKPNIYGSILRFEGQCTVFAPHLGGPCYRCMAPQPPPPGLVPSCAEGGVLGILPGIIGTLQATEAIKLITNIGQPLLGKLLHVDTLTMKFRTFQLRRDPDCPVCSDNPTITSPINYHQFCGVPNHHALPAISVQQLHTLQQQNQPHFLLDVREIDEYHTAQITGSTLIPLKQLPNRLNELPRQQKIIVHCKSGMRSANAVQLLQQAGFQDIHNLTGGILAWSREIDPTVPEY